MKYQNGITKQLTMKRKYDGTFKELKEAKEIENIKQQIRHYEDNSDANSILYAMLDQIIELTNKCESLHDRLFSLENPDYD